MNNILKAYNYYLLLGYIDIKVPWIVNEKYVKKTIDDKRPIITNFSKSQTHLIGSGEQGFLSLLDDFKLDLSKKYQTLTPCFRHDVIDELHQTEFLKLELIEFGDNYNECKMKVDNMIKNVIILFNEILGDNISVLLTDDKRSLFSSDIVYDSIGENIELGSYGIRNFNGYYYVYGTGFALSRMDFVIRKYFN